MLGKVINGVLTTPSANERKKIVITNPTDKILKSVLGYKDLIYDDEPEYDMENQYLEQDIEETDTTITVHWIVKDIVIEDIQPTE